MNRAVVTLAATALAPLAALTVALPTGAPGGPADAPSPVGQKPLLTPGDVTLVGTYPFTADGQATFGRGLTCRRVGGRLRFLTFSYGGSLAASAALIEFALPARPGTAITALTGRWPDVWSPGPKPNVGGGDGYGLWWEELPGGGRLWTTHCTDYPNGRDQLNQTLALSVRGLKGDAANRGGAAFDWKGEYGLAGVGQRTIHGGIQPIPQSFRDRTGLTQRYAVGWGGYTSLVAQGLIPSMGLMVVAVPDLSAYPNGTVLPAGDFRILADHRSGSVSRDWYAASTGPGYRPPFDRGVRAAGVVNYCDGGDRRPNPSTRPTEPPAAGAQWLSPAPDGRGRWVWTDGYFGNCCWIDGPSKQSFLAVGVYARGAAWYGGSTIHCDGRDVELQVFDPDDFARVLVGALRPWEVQPVASKLLTNDLTPLGLCQSIAGGGPGNAVAGACFDATTRRLYLWCTQQNHGYGCVLLEYAVNC